MPPWFGKQDGSPYRVFFATDIHGSEPTFRKFINAAKGYGVDALVLGGDISGKMLIPIIDLGAGKYTATLQSTTVSMTTDELPAFEKKLAALALQAAQLPEGELEKLRAEFEVQPVRQRLQEKVASLMDDGRLPQVASWFVCDARGTHLAGEFRPVV